MLGRTVISPWLFAATLAVSPARGAAEQEPFAESAESQITEPQGEVAPAATNNTTVEAPETVESAAAGNGDGPFAETGVTEGELASKAAAGEGDDPFAEAGAPADESEGPADTGATTDDGEDPFSETGATGGASDLADEYGFDPADEFASEEEPADRDPWEGFNRAVFRFNDTADRWVLKPVATSYRQVTPIFMQVGVSNFFGNLREVTNTINSVLQWKWGQAGNDAGRFLINSTVGIVGLFDVAQHVGLEQSDGEDFGQTLAVWGVPSGPYVVLPFLGPSSVRGMPGRVVDAYSNPMAYIDHDPTLYAFVAADLIQTRAGLLKAEALLKGDRYVLLRDAYLQRREFLINDGELEDDFGDDFGEDLDDYDL